MFFEENFRKGRDFKYQWGTYRFFYLQSEFFLGLGSGLGLGLGSGSALGLGLGLGLGLA